jgi:hypothetical protein
VKKEHENLDKPNMLKVIELLEAEKPITKKAACEILNITYNTPRLAKLIKEFKDREDSNKRLRDKLKGTPLSLSEVTIIVEEYLNGTPVSTISELTYRPTSLINKCVKELNVPLRTADASYQQPYFIEQDAISEEYIKDDLVYAARYQCPALIEKRYDSKDGPIYTIYLLGKLQCYASQPFWELADLRKIQRDLAITIKAATGLEPAYNPR